VYREIVVAAFVRVTYNDRLYSQWWANAGGQTGRPVAQNPCQARAHHADTNSSPGRSVGIEHQRGGCSECGSCCWLFGFLYHGLPPLRFKNFRQKKAPRLLKVQGAGLLLQGGG
jgi:hypothetical protein